MGKKKAVMSAEEELLDLARAGRRLRQMQRHAGRKTDAAVQRAEAEFDKLVEHVLTYRTPAIPWEQPPSSEEVQAS